MENISNKIGHYHPSYINPCELFCAFDLSKVLQNLADFQGIKKESFACILDSAHTRDYEKNSIICYKGECVDTLLYLFHGSIKAFKVDKYNREAVVNLYAVECAINGISPIINYDTFCDGVAKTTLQTLEPCRILSIKIDVFKDLLKDDIVLANNILQQANYALQELNYYTEISLMDSHAKVRALLLRNPNIFKKVSKKLIASLLNMSQETLSRILQDIS